MELPRLSELLLKLLAPYREIELVPRTLAPDHRRITLTPARNGTTIDCRSLATTVSLPVLDLEEAGIEYDRSGAYVYDAVTQLLRDRRFTVTPNGLLVDMIDQFVAVALALDLKTVTLEQVMDDSDCVTLHTNPFPQPGFVIMVDSPVKGLDISHAVVGPAGTILNFLVPYADIAHDSAAYKAITAARTYFESASALKEAELAYNAYLRSARPGFFSSLVSTIMREGAAEEQRLESSRIALQEAARDFEQYLAAVA